MAVTSASEGGIFRAASGVMLNRDARPVVHGVGEPIMASLSSYHYAVFARPLDDRRDPCQTAQGGVISSLQSIEGFSEQRGKDDPPHSGKDASLSCWLTSRMRACGLGCSSGDLHRRLAQHVQDMRGVEAPDAIANSGPWQPSPLGCELLCGASARSPTGRAATPPRDRFQDQASLEVAPELLSQAVCEAVALSTEVFGDARPLAQFDHDRVDDREQPEATRIAAQGGGHHLGVTDARRAP